jgi:hypothetical protein
MVGAVPIILAITEQLKARLPGGCLTLLPTDPEMKEG